MLAARPQPLLDNGGDLFVRFLEVPYAGLIGGREETTSGRMRREPIGLPLLVINDSPIKFEQFAENRHAVGQSTVESYLTITNRSTNGKRVTVFGYGACGRRVAAHFRSGFAEVSVVEIDPVTGLESLLDGFPVRPPSKRRSSIPEVAITAPGARGAITAANLPLLVDGVILLNLGHFPLEIDVPGNRGGRCGRGADSGYRRDRVLRARQQPSRPPSDGQAHGVCGRSDTRSSRWISASRSRRAFSRRTRRDA